MESKFTQQQIIEYKEAFNLFDKDRDGCISMVELSNLMKSMGQSLNKRELQELVREMDVNRNGTLEFNEFLVLMSKLSKDTDFEDELVEAFKIFDQDNHGMLTGLELKMMMMRFGDKVSEKEAEGILREAEIALDKEIDYEELVKLALAK